MLKKQVCSTWPGLFIQKRRFISTHQTTSGIWSNECGSTILQRKNSSIWRTFRTAQPRTKLIWIDDSWKLFLKEFAPPYIVNDFLISFDWLEYLQSMHEKGQISFQWWYFLLHDTHITARRLHLFIFHPAWTWRFFFCNAIKAITYSLVLFHQLNVKSQDL